MLLSALIFSIIAAAVAWPMGRFDTASAPRLTASALVLLLVTPLLSLLPKLHVLPVAAKGGEFAVGSGWIPWTTLWLAGGFAYLVRLTMATLELRCWRGKSKHLKNIQLGHRRVEVRILTGLNGPHACGVFRPQILLPEQSSQWTPSVHSMVIAHELAHHRRRDPLWRLIAEVACVIHWFNPFVWWLARHHAIQSEFACDAMVISKGVSPSNYADALCDLASSSPSLAPALNQSSGLRSRVVRLMDPKPPFSPVVTSSVAVLVLLTGAALLVLRPSSPGETPAAHEIEIRHSANPFPG